MNILKRQLLPVFVIIAFSIQGQELSRYVFASGGDAVSDDNVTFSYTIGQAGLVGSLIQSELSLIAGFQQNDSAIPNSVIESKNQLTLEVYPNPFQDEFTLSLKTTKDGELEYFIFNNCGKVVHTNRKYLLNGEAHSQKVDLNNQPPGFYNLSLFYYSKNNKLEQFHIKLIKR